MTKKMTTMIEKASDNATNAAAAARMAAKQRLQERIDQLDDELNSLIMAEVAPRAAVEIPPDARFICWSINARHVPKRLTVGFRWDAKTRVGKQAMSVEVPMTAATRKKALRIQAEKNAVQGVRDDVPRYQHVKNFLERHPRLLKKAEELGEEIELQLQKDRLEIRRGIFPIKKKAKKKASKKK